MVGLRLLLLSFLACFQNGATMQHTAGGITVDVSLELVDENNSTKYCVEYLAGDDYNRDYETACFTKFFTDGGTFKGCEVQFGNKICVNCFACTTFEREVGYDLDCFNAQPSENTNACVALNDFNIQEVLVDSEFEGVNLLDINITDTNGGSGGGNGADSAAWSYFMEPTLFSVVLLFAFAM